VKQGVCVCVHPEGSEWRVLRDAAEALGYEGLEHEQHAADEAQHQRCVHGLETQTAAL